MGAYTKVIVEAYSRLFPSIEKRYIEEFIEIISDIFDRIRKEKGYIPLNMPVNDQRLEDFLKKHPEFKDWNFLIKRGIGGYYVNFSELLRFSYQTGLRGAYRN